MQRFQNILVGVDLSEGDRLVTEKLTKPNREAVDRALWLAKSSSATVTFFYTLDVSPVAQRMILKSHPNIQDDANQLMDQLVSEAKERGVTALSEVQFGCSWLEIIRKVQQDSHDLVVVGTRQLGHVQGLVLGSTGIKLLRKCPCPVWVTLPLKHDRVASVLVAHCLRPVGDLALELGASMAELSEASLHVYHSLDLPELELGGMADIPREKLGARQAEAEQQLLDQLAGHHHLTPPRLHVLTKRPEVAIPELVHEFDIDLLVTGTVGKAGVAGLISGSTTERLLPRITCSVLAVKPPGFVSPVT